MPKEISCQENLESTANNLEESEQQANDHTQIEWDYSAGRLSDTIIKGITERKKGKSRCYE